MLEELSQPQTINNTDDVWVHVQWYILIVKTEDSNSKCVFKCI